VPTSKGKGGQEREKEGRGKGEERKEKERRKKEGREWTPKEFSEMTPLVVAGDLSRRVGFF